MRLQGEVSQRRLAYEGAEVGRERGAGHADTGSQRSDGPSESGVAVDQARPRADPRVA
jgi:hypothetical protein